MCIICTTFAHPNAQDLRKIVLLSPIHNICARFVQDCISFPNVQYMRKICTRLHFSPHCAIYVQKLHKIVLFSAMCYTLPTFMHSTSIIKQVIKFSIFLFKSISQTTYNKEKNQIICDFFLIIKNLFEMLRYR